MYLDLIQKTVFALVVEPPRKEDDPTPCGYFSSQTWQGSTFSALYSQSGALTLVCFSNRLKSTPIGTRPEELFLFLVTKVNPRLRGMPWVRPLSLSLPPSTGDALLISPNLRRPFS